VDIVQNEIKQFLDANIKSIDQLEILRVLAESQGKGWNLADLSKELQSSPETISAHIAELSARGLLITSSPGGDVISRFGAATPELESQVSSVLQLYQERPVTMIKLVYAQANQRLRTFSDAFKIRKES
jgi:DNA-binding MarR family transcriptional regulator